MGLSRQYIHKLLKGQQNLTFETISKLETVLGIELIQIPSEIVEYRTEEITRSRTNRINKDLVKPQVVSKLKYQASMNIVHFAVDQNSAA
jgi:transcriptional regulator with XRE-family HTH domain